MVNKIQQIFEFRNDIVCTNRIDISRQYEFVLDYVHESLNDLDRLFQNSNMNLPTTSAQIPM